MKTTRNRQTPESRPPRISRLAYLKNLFPLLGGAALLGTFADVSSAQFLQPAGDVIMNLRSIDLDPANTVWTNNTMDVFSVGNLHTQGNQPANVQGMSYTDPVQGGINVNALLVNGSGQSSMVSSLQVPAQILGHGTVSAEAWVYANSVGTSSARITSAVVAYGNVNNDPKADHQRDFNYSIGNGNGAVSGFADDANWTPDTFPTAGVWHYLAFTYDGTTFLAYQDGVLNTTAPKPNWNTTSGVMCVGSDGATGGGDPFQGYIACARSMTGVLSAAQIANNFNVGLLADYGVIALTPTAAPSTNAFLGDTVTLTEVAQATGELTYQWQTDGGNNGASFAPVSGATSSTLVVNTGSLSVGNFEYRVVVTGASVATSAPVTLKINTPSGPILSQDISPATTSNLFVGSGVTFTASFIGNQPITYTWQVSKGGGAFVGITNSTTSTLTLANLQLSDSGQYRLFASNSVSTAVSSATTVNVQPLSALPALQVAGNLLVQLEPADLNSNNTVWPNKIPGLGDFTALDGLPLVVTTLSYNSQPVNALAVNGNGLNVVNSALLAPAAITGNGAVSVEAWIFPTTISGNNTVVGYGVQGGSSQFKSEDREFDFGNSGGSAFSGNFGGDTGWNGSLTANTWHYVTWTYDGTTLKCYEDSVLNTQNNNGPLATIPSVAIIGGGIAGADPTTTNRTDVFAGDIATVRVSSGVLSASQILNNFIAGPTKTVAIVLSDPILAPTNSVFYGDAVTASVTNAQSLQTLTYQWQTDNGGGGVTWSNITGQTDTNYSFSTSILPRTSLAANYEYRLVASGNLGTVVTSAPVTLTVRPSAPPTVLADTTPLSSALFVGQQITFAASFTGNQPITNQWQISINHGASFQDISGQTGSTLTLTGLQAGNSGQYRLKGSNAFGSTNSTPATLVVFPTSAEPTVQVAGHLIVDLEPSGLETNAGTFWHNASTDTNSVGDFTFVGTVGPLNTATVLFNGQPLNVLNVAGNGANSVEALNVQAPAILLGANPCSMEAWVFATDVSGNNTVVNYGDQTSQSGNLDRALNYQNQPYGAFTGYFGNADVQWLPKNTGATANAWHYIAVTYDGSNLDLYQDGKFNNGLTGITLLTDETYISVGSGTGNSTFAGAGGLSGYVAAARVETGVLTPSQIAQNYAAGPAPGLTVGLSIPQLAPLTSTFSHGVLTLSWNAGVLQEATSANGPWTTDTSVTSPHPVTPATAGAPVKFYRLQY